MLNFAFFGSSRFSVIILDQLEKNGLVPSLIVTTPDKPQGRKMIVTPTPVKEWGQKHGIEVLDPAKLDAAFVSMFKEKVASKGCQVAVVASYGKIIPAAILDMPARKTLNIHPSLLPKYRGASPLQSAMLDDVKNTGVTIMRVDEKMDHGPIVAQIGVTVPEWPVYEDFEKMMAEKGADLLAKILPDWIEGKIEAKEQDHSKANFTKKITKEDGEIDLSGDAYLNFRKIQAFHEWPQAYFFHERGGKKLRVKITQASFKNGELKIEKVIPEGSKEMTYADFLRGFK